MSTKLIRQADLSDKLKLKYDCRTQKASLSEKIYIQRVNKLMVTADTSTNWDGATYLARTKFERPYCHSVGIKYSQAGGPVLRYKARPNPRLKIKTETATKPQTIAASMQYKPELREKYGLLCLQFCIWAVLISVLKDNDFGVKPLTAVLRHPCTCSR